MWRHHPFHPLQLTTMKWNIVDPLKLATEWQATCALRPTLLLSIASRVSLITILQHSFAPLRMRLSSIVTPHISSTIHILTTATLFRLPLQKLQPITTLSIALRPRPITIKWVSPAQPPQYRPILSPMLGTAIQHRQVPRLYRTLQSTAVSIWITTKGLQVIVPLKVLTFLTRKIWIQKTGCIVGLTTITTMTSTTTVSHLSQCQSQSEL